jgi:hypothetical protein
MVQDFLIACQKTTTVRVDLPCTGTIRVPYSQCCQRLKALYLYLDFMFRPRCCFGPLINLSFARTPLARLRPRASSLTPKNYSTRYSTYQLINQLNTINLTTQNSQWEMGCALSLSLSLSSLITLHPTAHIFLL